MDEELVVIPLPTDDGKITYAVLMVLVILGVSTIFLDIVHPINLN